MKRWIHLPRSFFSTSLFLYLVPLIFLLEKYRQTIGTIQPLTVLYCLLLYWIGALLFAIGFWRIFRDDMKAHLITALLIIINCYFGQIQVMLAKADQLSFFSRYRFFIPFTFLLIVVCFYLLKRVRIISPVLGKAASAACILLALFKCSQIVSMYQGTYREHSSQFAFTKSDSLIRPDIYLILSDGYAGSTELKDLLHYDNGRFYDQLRERAFWVGDSSHGNYTVTPFSMASFFSMDYFHTRKLFHIDLIEARRMILKNPFLQFIEDNGYQFRNYSIFQPEGSTNKKSYDAFKYNSFQLLNSGTLLQQFTYLLEAKMNENSDFFHIDDANVNKIKESNRYAVSSLIEESSRKDPFPKFIYSHILAPHYPYMADSLGHYYSSETLKKGSRFSKEDYIAYLKGVNNTLIKTIDSIKKNTDGNAIIILMSDHGFRQFKEPQYARYFYSNLLSIYLPERKYDQFYNSMSNVNFLRAMLNQAFDQKLPFLKDSMVYYPIRGIQFKNE